MGRFRSSPDVESVGFPDSGNDDYMDVLVHFVDELERTRDEELIRIHEARRPSRPEDIIQQYLASSEGRARLAQTMVAPLRQRIDYQSIARRTFLVEQMPEGALPVYDRDPQAGALATLNFGNINPLFMNPTSIGEGAWMAEAVNGQARIEGLTGWASPVQLRVGDYLELSGSPFGPHNGIFQIMSIATPTSVWVINSNANIDFARGNVQSWRVFPAYTPLPVGVHVEKVAEAPRPEPRPAWDRIIDDSFIPDE